MEKIKKLFLGILIALTCTGCSIEYNINITENDIEETINVKDQITTNRTKNDILKHYEMWYPTFVNFIEEGESIEIQNFNKKIDGIKYHDKTIEETNDGYNYTYKYTYPIDEYYDSYVLASVFPEFTIYKDFDNLVIRTSKENFLCNYEYYESAKINITIDPNIYKLNYTNTSNIKDNTYTWILNKDNCSDGEIILTINKKMDFNYEPSKPKEDSKNDKESFGTKFGLYIFCGVLIIIILIGYILFNKLKRKNTNTD
jgi:hypothetical protein